MMKQPKVGAIILTKDVFDNAKNLVLVDPIPIIPLEIIPNNYTFKLNFSLLNFEEGQAYTCNVKIEDENGENVFEQQINNMKMTSKNKQHKIADTFVTLNAQNVRFFSEGDHKITVSIFLEDDPESKDTKELIVPVIRKDT